MKDSQNAYMSAPVSPDVDSPVSAFLGVLWNRASHNLLDVIMLLAEQNAMRSWFARVEGGIGHEVLAQAV